MSNTRIPTGSSPTLKPPGPGQGHIYRGSTAALEAMLSPSVTRAAQASQEEALRKGALFQQAQREAMQRLRANGTIPSAPARSAASPATPVPSRVPRINPSRLARAVPAPARAALRNPSVSGGALAAGVDFAFGVAAGENPAQAGVEALGAGLGFAAGAALGTALGSPALGFVLGSVGAHAGGMLASRLYRRLFPNAGNSPLQNMHSPIERGPAPPFYGGQSHTLYEVHFDVFDYWRSSGELVGSGPSRYVSVNNWGTIKGLQFSPGGGEIFVIGGTANNPNDVQLKSAWSASPAAVQQFFYEANIVSVFREDRQPDTGGNPAPAPGTQPQPALAPITAPSPRVQPQVQPQTAPQPTGHPSNAPDSPLGVQLAPAPVSNPATTPTPTTPTAPATPGAPARPDQANPDERGGLPGWLPLTALPLGGIPAIMPSGVGRRGSPGVRQTPTTQPQAQPQTPATPGSPTSPNSPTTCQYDGRNIAGKVDQTNTTLGVIQTVQLANMQSMLTTIDTKLGAQIPGGGISGQLGKMFDFAKKTWNFLQVDRILNILTYIGVLHNAYMLSNNIGQTLFEMIGTALNVFGIQDADGNSLPIGEMVGQWTENFFKRLIGEDTVSGMKEGWKKANRIYQAAANIVNTVQSMIMTAVEVIEAIGNYTGKIGNALIKSGTILQDSFNWMNTNSNYSTNKLINRLEQIQNGFEVVNDMASGVLDYQELSEQLYTDWAEFKEAWEDGEKFVKEDAEKIISNTLKPDLEFALSDEAKAEVDE